MTARATIAQGFGNGATLALMLLRDEGPMTAPEIRRATGRDAATVWRWLRELERAGAVQPDGVLAPITWRPV